MEYLWAIIGGAAGVSVVIFISPKTAYFLPNAIFYYIPQVLALFILYLTGARPSVFGGTAFALAIYLAAFQQLLIISRDPDASLGWVFYLLFIPPALIAAVYASHKLRIMSKIIPIASFIITAIAVLIGALFLPAIYLVVRLILQL